MILILELLRNMKIRDIKPQDKDMVDGIVDIIKQVRDKDNREEIATNMVKQLKREKIILNYEDFLKACK
jgi:hypothetical protein